MENQTIVELIDKNNFTISDLRDTVYTTLSDKSTRHETLSMKNIKCTLAFDKPPFVEVKNPEKYYYFIMELGDVRDG